MARSTIRGIQVCCLATMSWVCPAQDMPAIPARIPKPDQIQIEQLMPPETLTSLVTQRRWDEVLNVSLRGLSENPGDPVLHYWAGVACFHQRDFVQAELSLRSAEKLGLDTALLHEALGVTYYAIRQRVLFLQEMQAAIRADPARSTPYHYLGRYYEHDANDYLKAISYFDKALERDPGDFKSLHFRAFCLQMLGRQEEARAGYEVAIRHVEASSAAFGWPYQKLAELVLQTDPHAALEYSQKAVKLDPDVASNHLVIAKVLESIGDFAAAIAAGLEAARLKPNDPAIRYVLARLYKKNGNTAASAEQLKLHEKLRAIYVPSDN